MGLELDTADLQFCINKNCKKNQSPLTQTQTEPAAEGPEIHEVLYTDECCVTLLVQMDESNGCLVDSHHVPRARAGLFSIGYLRGHINKD